MITRTATKIRVVISSKLLPLAEAASVADNTAGGARQHSLLTNPRVQTASRRIISSTVRRMVVSSLTSSEDSDRGTESNFRAPVLNQTMDLNDGIPTIIVAGAAGQLGRKIYKRLVNTTAAEYVDLPLSARPVDAMADTQGAFPTRFRIVLMDSKPRPDDMDITDARGHEVEYIQCDFTKFEKTWTEKFSKAYVAFLLATRVHFPMATSDEAYDSMLINANLLEACVAGRVERVVLGSSTDVVRGRVQKSLDNQDKKSITEVERIDPQSDPEIANQESLCGGEIDSRLYAAAKVAGEAQAKAMVSAGHLKRVIVLRLGACYPVQDIGPNAEAKARLAQSSELSTTIDGDSWLFEWFKQVQLKDEDLDHIVDCCVTPSLDSTPEKRMIFVNAVSSTKSGAKLRIENNDLGYVPPSEAQSQPPPAV